VASLAPPGTRLKVTGVHWFGWLLGQDGSYELKSRRPAAEKRRGWADEASAPT